MPLAGARVAVSVKSPVSLSFEGNGVGGVVGGGVRSRRWMALPL